MTNWINARDWVFQIYDGAATWLEITNINQWSDDPTTDEEITEGTVFSSAGNWEGQALQRGDQIELQGHYDRHPQTGARAAGQARLDVLGLGKGPASVGQLRFRHTIETTWTVWDCIVSITSRGGGNNAFTGWGVRLRKTGAATTAAVV